MTNLEYTLENPAGTKSITIKDVKSNIDDDETAVTAFGDKLSGYSADDYGFTKATKVVIEETIIVQN